MVKAVEDCREATLKKMSLHHKYASFREIDRIIWKHAKYYWRKFSTWSKKTCLMRREKSFGNTAINSNQLRN